MKSLAMITVATLLLFSEPAHPQVASYVYTPGLYYLYNNTPRWAACRITYSRHYWVDFWLAPYNNSAEFPQSTGWYCELR